MANKRLDTTVAINAKRNTTLTKGCLEIVKETEELIKTSDVVHYLIDNYLDKAIADIIEKRIKEQSGLSFNSRDKSRDEIRKIAG